MLRSFSPFLTLCALSLGLLVSACSSFGTAESEGQKLYRLNAVTTYTVILARDYAASPQANPSVVATIVAAASSAHAGLLESDMAYDEGGGRIASALALASGSLDSAESVVNIALDIDLEGGNILSKVTKLGATWADSLAEMRALRKEVAKPVLDSLGEGEDPSAEQWAALRAVRDVVFAAIAENAT